MWGVLIFLVYVSDQLHPSLCPVKDYLQMEPAAALVGYLTAFAVERPAGLGNEDHCLEWLFVFKHPFLMSEVFPSEEVGNLLAKLGKLGAVVLIMEPRLILVWAHGASCRN